MARALWHAQPLETALGVRISRTLQRPGIGPPNALTRRQRCIAIGLGPVGNAASFAAATFRQHPAKPQRPAKMAKSWTLAISTENGRAVLTAAGEDNALVVFGATVPF